MWIFWQDLMRVQSDSCCEICHFILTRLHTLHSVINRSQSIMSRQIEPSLWRLIDLKCPMWACQSTLSSVNDRQSALKVFWCIQLVASTLESLISSSICCLAVSSVEVQSLLIGQKLPRVLILWHFMLWCLMLFYFDAFLCWSLSLMLWSVRHLCLYAFLSCCLHSCMLISVSTLLTV